MFRFTKVEALTVTHRLSACAHLRADKVPSGRMSVVREAILVVLVALCAAPTHALAQSTQLDQWAVRGVTLLDGRGGAPLNDAVIVVDRGVIRCAGTSDRCPLWGIPSIIDGTGLWAVPGLVDSHAHLEWSADSASVQEQQLVRFALGITTVRDAGTHDLDAGLRARSRAADPFSPEPRLVVTGTLDPGNLEAFGSPDYASLARTLISQGADQLKYKAVLEPDEMEALFRVTNRANVPVFGHAWEGPPPVTYVDELLDAGVAGLSHLLAFSAAATADLEGLPEAPDPAQDLDAFWQWRKDLWLHADSAALAGIIDRLVEAGVYLEPTLSSEKYWGAEAPVPEDLVFLGELPRLLDLVPFRTPSAERARRDAEERFGASYEVMRAFVGAYHAAGGRLLAGPDEVAPGIGLHEELGLLADAGVPAAELIEIATSQAAEALGTSSRFGTIESGKVADLLLIEADPTMDIGSLTQIWRVVKGGVVYDPDVILEPVRLRHERRGRELWVERAKRLLPPAAGFVLLVLVVAWWIRWRRRW